MIREIFSEQIATDCGEKCLKRDRKSRKSEGKSVKTQIFRSGIFPRISNLIFWIFLWNKAIEMTPTLLVSAFVVAVLGQAAVVQVQLKFPSF